MCSQTEFHLFYNVDCEGFNVIICVFSDEVVAGSLFHFSYFPYLVFFLGGGFCNRNIFGLTGN